MRPFIHMQHYVSASAREKEKKRVSKFVWLANALGHHPIVRIRALTRRHASPSIPQEPPKELLGIGAYVR